MRVVDVAVVGAGPAGSTAANVLASSGMDVVLIDRKREIGTPVQCGGFIPEAHELRLLIPNAVLPDSLVNIPKRCILNRSKVQRMISPSGQIAEFPVDGRTVDRRSFDKHLAYLAAKAGAALIPATKVTIGEEKVTTEGDVLMLSGHLSEKVRAKVIIGADGPSSVISRSLGNRRLEIGTCLEYEMVDVNVDPQAAEMYFGTKYAPGGYAWIIPQGNDQANVGVGIRSEYMKVKEGLSTVLNRFVKEHPIAGPKLREGEIVSVMSGAVPAGGMPQTIQSGRILLAGDAAGQVMATSGGGIPLAMVAGRIAGESSRDHLKGEVPLSEYKVRVDAEIGREISNSVGIRRMVDMIMHSDRSMDLLFSMMDPDHMKRIQQGRIPGALSAICRTITSRMRNS